MPVPRLPSGESELGNGNGISCISVASRASRPVDVEIKSLARLSVVASCVDLGKGGGSRGYMKGFHQDNLGVVVVHFIRRRSVVIQSYIGLYD